MVVKVLLGPDRFDSPEGADSSNVPDSPEGRDVCDGPLLVLAVLMVPKIVMILMVLKVHEGPECS